MTGLEEEFTTVVAKRRPSFAWLLIPALGLLFSIIAAATNFWRDSIIGQPSTWKDVFASSIPRWLLHSFLAPLVGWYSDRFPVESGKVPRRLLLHAVGGVAYVSLHSLIIALYFRVLGLLPAGETIQGAFGRLTMANGLLNLVVYIGIAGAYHALRNYREAKRREILATRLEASLVEARLAALRSQLNPHFLFNTLNATSTLALAGESRRVVETLSALSDLLRVSLDPALPQEVPLERELEILAPYLEIQRIRFGDRLTVALDVDPQLRTALVPSMILQPLVENSFEHGIAARPGPGRVTIRAGRDGNSVRLRVEDTGPGFNGAPSTNGSGNGIGLPNTGARLEQLYGDARRIAQGNLPDGGAFVELGLPLHFGAGEG